MRRLSVLVLILPPLAAACTLTSQPVETEAGSPASAIRLADQSAPEHVTTTTAPQPPESSTSTTVHKTPPVPAVVPPAWPEGGLVEGDESPAVRRLQTELVDGGFRVGNIDGVYGGGTWSAVMAFEKFEGLDRDGIADPAMLAALAKPSGRSPISNLGDSRIEIDLERQLIFARPVDGPTVIINTSTGNGEPYKASNGKYYNANTPRGDYSIERRIDGNRKAYLGTLYRPLYFKRGWAIHGSSNVPGYPASHGCARTSNRDQDWLFGTFENGTDVIVYDNWQPPDLPGTSAT